MEQQFDAVLTGSDSPIEGVATFQNVEGYNQTCEFKSIDGTLHLIIGQEANGQWVRIGGTDPYFAGWVDELAEQLNNPTPDTLI